MTLVTDDDMNTEFTFAFGIVEVNEESGGGCEEDCLASMKSPKSSSSQFCVEAPVPGPVPAPVPIPVPISVPVPIPVPIPAEPGSQFKKNILT